MTRTDRSFFRKFSQNNARIILLFVIVILLSIVCPPGTFLTWENISNVIFQQAPFTMIMSFGMTLAIITKGIDKSMGSILVLSSVLSATYIKNGQFFVGVLVAVFVGLICGLANGLIITRVGVAPFIATYGVENIALGLAYIFTSGGYIYDFPDTFRGIANGSLFGIPNIAIATFFIFITLHFIISKTTFGRKVYAAGFNFTATSLSGINAKNIVTSVYVINGLLSAIAGLLYMARLNAADPGISGGFTLDSIAASLIGGTSFGGGKGSISGAVIGSLMIVFIRNGMNIMGVSTNWQQAAVGFMILFSVILERVSERISSKFNKI